MLEEFDDPTNYSIIDEHSDISYLFCVYATT